MTLYYYNFAYVYFFFFLIFPVQLKNVKTERMEKNCTKECGNCKQQQCHHTNGTCLFGCSSSSYEGETCKEEACL